MSWAPGTWGEILDPPWAAWHGDLSVGGKMGEKWTSSICTLKVLNTPGTVLTQSPPPHQRPCDSLQGVFLEEVAEWVGLEHCKRGKEGI